jgi:hypothetical protein
MSIGFSPAALDQALDAAPSIELTFTREWQLQSYRGRLYYQNHKGGGRFSD